MATPSMKAVLVLHPQIQKQCADVHLGHILSLQSSPGLPDQNSLINISETEREPRDLALGTGAVCV